MPVTTARNAKTTTSTTPVVFKTVVKEGHVTLLSSEKVSLNFAPTRRNQFGFLFFVFVAFAIAYLIARPYPSYKLGQSRVLLQLFGFFVLRVLFAERTILVHNQSIRVILLVLNAVIVSVLTFRTFKRNFGSCRFGCHNQNSIQKITPLDRRVELVYHTFKRLSIFFASFLNFFYIFTKGFLGGIFREKTPLLSS